MDRLQFDWRAANVDAVVDNVSKETEALFAHALLVNNLAFC